MKDSPFLSVGKVNPRAASAKRPPRLSAVAPVTPVSILIVDGNDHERDYYAQRLKIGSPDYLVFEAASGKAALDLCQSRTFDCVVLELDLPDMSGFEVLVKLVPIAHRPQVAVIVLTRLMHQSVLQVSLRVGAHTAMSKTHASGDLLDLAILKAISKVPQRKEGEQTLTG
ncbi:MAG TPA: response regulator [Nitrospira sp.]|nr:response regulator [Nitrospira sp.]